MTAITQFLLSGSKEKSLRRTTVTLFLQTCSLSFSGSLLALTTRKTSSQRKKCRAEERQDQSKHCLAREKRGDRQRRGGREGGRGFNYKRRDSRFTLCLFLRHTPFSLYSTYTYICITHTVQLFDFESKLQ